MPPDSSKGGLNGVGRKMCGSSQSGCSGNNTITCTFLPFSQMRVNAVYFSSRALRYIFRIVWLLSCGISPQSGNHTDPATATTTGSRASFQAAGMGSRSPLWGEMERGKQKQEDGEWTGLSEYMRLQKMIILKTIDVSRQPPRQVVGVAYGWARRGSTGQC